MSTTGFHDGELDVQHRAGMRREAARLEGMLAPAHLDGGAARFLAQRELAVLTGRDRDGRLWTSPLPGPPGFLDAHGMTLGVHATPPAGGPLHDLPPRPAGGRAGHRPGDPPPAARQRHAHRGRPPDPADRRRPGVRQLPVLHPPAAPPARPGPYGGAAGGGGARAGPGAHRARRHVLPRHRASDAGSRHLASGRTARLRPGGRAGPVVAGLPGQQHVQQTARPLPGS